MKKFILIICIAFCGFVSAQSAIEYHDKMIAQVNKVSKAMNLFNSSLETDSAYLMHTSRSYLKKTIDSALTEINAIEEYKGDDDWHKALLIQLNYYKSCVDKEFVKFIDYSLRMTILNEDEQTDFFSTFNKVKTHNDQNEELVRESYLEFCKNNGIKVE